MDISLNGYTYKDVQAVKQSYQDGSLALVLEDQAGDIIAVVSVWTGVPPEDGCIWVKDYSENAGILEALEEAGVLERTGGGTNVGYMSVPEARVLA